MNTMKYLLFLFLISSNYSFALFQDSRELSDEAQAQLKEFSKANGQLSSEQKISKSAQIAREAHLFCAGKINGPVGETITNLMKVGLHNYCDQYQDDESFCNCIGEVTYENKLKKEDLEDFQQKIQKENLKNLGYSSMKALVNDKSLSIKYDITVGRTENFQPMKENIACSHPKTFFESIKSDCSEEEIAQLEKGYNLYTSECKNCSSSQLMQNLPRDSRRGSFSSAESFISLGGHIASQESIKLIENNFFKSSELQELSSVVGNGKYSVINEVQQDAIVDALAKRIFAKNKGSLQYRFPAKVTQTSFTKYEDLGLIESLDGLDLFQSDFFYMNGKNGELRIKQDVDNRISDYLHYFEKKINPAFVFNADKFKTVEDVKAAINKIFELQMISNLKNSCTRTQDAFRKSCKALKESAIAFDFGKYAKSVRNNNFENDKFKFDQLYCVAQNKNSSLISEKVMIKGEGWFAKSYEKVYALKQSSNPIEYNFSSFIDGKDGKLNSFDWTIGSQSDSILAASGGRASDELEKRLLGIEGYGYSHTTIEGDVKKSLFKPIWDINAGNFSSVTNPARNFNQPSFRPTSSYTPGSSGGPTTRRPSSVISANDSLIATTKAEVERDLAVEFKNSADNVVLETRQQVAAELSMSLPNVVENDQAKIENSDIPPKAIIVEEDSSPAVTQNAGQVPGEVSKPSEIEKMNEAKLEEATNKTVTAPENFIKPDSTAPSFFNTFTGGKDSSLEKRFENLKSSLASSFGKKSEEEKKENDSELRERVVDINNPIENSFKPESKSKGQNENSSIEIEKMKLELEKMKLELAKSEQEIELQKLEDSKAQAALAKKESIQTLVSNQMIKPTSTNQADVKRSASKSTSTTVPSSKQSNTASRTSSDLPSSSVSASSSTRQAAQQAPSFVPVATKSNRTTGVSKGSSSQVSASEGSGTLLTAVSATNEQISKVAQSPAPNFKSVKSISEVETFDQEVLAKYYESGTQIVVESDKSSEEGLDTLKLEKDEETGLISVVKVDLTKAKRAPAAVVEKAVERKPRKVFSYDEFKTILDSSREE